MALGTTATMVVVMPWGGGGRDFFKKGHAQYTPVHKYTCVVPQWTQVQVCWCLNVMQTS